jgi:lysozyme family protein
VIAFLISILKSIFGVKEITVDTTAAPSIQPNSDIFDTLALPLTLIFEGGYVNNPNDAGKGTKHGITQNIYNNYRQTKNLPINDVKNISDAEVYDIYLHMFWLPSQCNKMPDKVATVTFDTSVNSGQGRAIMTLQEAVGAHVDGGIGPETLSKVSGFDPLKLANSFLDIRRQFYNRIVEKDPTQKVFLAGWLRRVNFTSDYVNGVKTLDEIKKSW